MTSYVPAAVGVQHHWPDRGERPESGAIYTEEIEKEAERLGGEMRLVSLIGRFWSLDREENWDRIEKSYRWLVEGKGRAVSVEV